MASRLSSTLKRADHGDTSSTGSDRLPSFQQPLSHVRLLQQIRSRAPRLNLRSPNGKARASPSDTDEGRFREKSSTLDRSSTKSTDSLSHSSADGLESTGLVCHSAPEIKEPASQAFDEPDLIPNEERVRFAIDTYQAKLDKANEELILLEEQRKKEVTEFMSRNSGAGVNPRGKERFDARQLQLQNNIQVMQKKVAKYQDRIKQLEEKGISGVDQSVLQDVKYAWQAMAKHSLLPPIFKGGRLFGSNHNLRGDNVAEDSEALPPSAGSPSPQGEGTGRSEYLSSDDAVSIREELMLELKNCKEYVTVLESKVESLEARVIELTQKTERISELGESVEFMSNVQNQLSAQVLSNQDFIQRMQYEWTEAVNAVDGRVTQLQAQMHANHLQTSEQCNVLEDVFEKNEARITEIEHKVDHGLPGLNEGSTGRSVMVAVVNSLIVILRFLLSTWLRLGRRETIVIFTAVAVFFISFTLSYWWRK